MSRQAKLALAILGGAILIAALMILLRPAPEEVPRQEGAPLVRAVPFTPTSGPIAVLGSGSVHPREEVTVSAEVAGRITYVNPAFQEGGMVTKGAVLLRIDASDYENRVRSARADVAAQDVAVLQASEEARIAQEELRRFAGQQQGDLLAPMIDENDHASRILPPRDIAEQPARANGNVAPEPGRLATREPQLRSAKAARERAAAQLADARLALSRTVVRAPFTGLVRSESAAVGQLVQPGQELGSIVEADSFEVRIPLTESEAALVPGLLSGSRDRIPASVFFDYGGRTWRWSAYVDRADPILDAETRTIDVFLRVPSPQRGGVPANAEVGESGQGEQAPPLLVGSFVNARITGASDVTYAEVNARHLRPGNKVWVVRDGKLRILPARVIQRSDEIAYITTPSLSKGGKLVTSSLRSPVDGMAVRIENGSRKATSAAPAASPAPGSRAND